MSDTHRDADLVDEVHESHGHSVAAWTSVGVVLLGSFIMCVAVVVTHLWLFVAGAVVTVIGGLLAKVMGAMGFGAPKSRSVH